VHRQFKSGRSLKFVFNDAFAHFMLPSLKRQKKSNKEGEKAKMKYLFFLDTFKACVDQLGRPFLDRSFELSAGKLL